MTTAPAVIAVDWGSTNLRASLCRDGVAVAHTEGAWGLKAARDQGFDIVFAESCGDWLAEAPEAIVILSGMVGSRGGWREAGYVDCPAGLDALAGALTPVDAAGRTLWIAPGLRHRSAAGHWDVMRGEETQTLGALSLLDPADTDATLFCLPGTHSKWVLCQGRRIEQFSTFVTGETFAVLDRHSLLGPGDEAADAPPDWTAFDRGIDRSAQPGGLLHHLFSARTERLFETVDAAGQRDLLSGLLIGHELRAALALFGHAVRDRPVRIVASTVLTARYDRACTALDLITEPPPDGAQVAGACLLADRVPR
ncbi:MAG: 2-dehydro-3-deoxygalactonokinase [Inquilinaceae bacterium]